MKKVAFGISLLITLGLVYLMSISIIPGAPPLGKFLNPFTGFWQNAEKINDFDTETIFEELDLQKPVRVVYDDKLVPHIFAENIFDAATVQGYIEARYRLFQMDFSTRAAIGRLSEILGPGKKDGYIKYDQQKRRKGMLFAAENSLETWKKSPEEFKIVEQYSKGVNTYINSLDTKDYPFEYKLLNFEPEEWSPLKSAIFLKVMAETLSSRYDDMEASNALASFGKETFNFLYPERNPKESPIIPKSVEWDFENVNTPTIESSESIGSIFYEPMPKPKEFIGSNNWAVDGTKTASGDPILCNDPHLNLTLPAIWFEIQIHTPETNVYGVSLPGVPGVTIGFNEDIAWGFTNVGHDVTDLFEIKWTDKNKTSYYLDEEVKEAEMRIETIKVKGQADIIDTVRYTYWGPVAYESEDDSKSDLALKWLAHEGKGNELKTFLGINFAKNFDDYYNGMTAFDNPAQNVVFASRDGDIALKVQGKFPIKKDQQGRFVQNGSTTKSDWNGYVPFDQTPFVLNPERGFVSSANQFSADTTYPYYYNGGFEDFRGRILNRKLAEMSEITPQHMKDLQGNNYSIKAEEIVPIFLKYMEGKNMDAAETEVFNILKNWDFNYDKDDVAPLLFDSLSRDFYKLTWDEIYELHDRKNHPMLFPEQWRTIQLMETDPNNAFFDIKSTRKVETLENIIEQTFRELVKKSVAWKVEGKYPTWAGYRDAKINHMIPGLAGFSSKFINAGGSGDVLNALNIRGGNSFGPSWRMIVELGDEVKGYGVYPAGQSGNPGSPYYDSMVEKWANGEYYELLFLKNKKAKGDRILFVENYQ